MNPQTLLTPQAQHAIASQFEKFGAAGRQMYHELLEGRIDQDEFEAAFADFPEQDQHHVIKTTSYKPKQPVQTKQSSIEKKRPAEPKAVESSDFQQRLIMTAKQLKQTAEQIASIKGLQTLAQDMQARARRLEHSRFTIALFGAFSAGKSSFANALIGKKYCRSHRIRRLRRLTGSYRQTTNIRTKQPPCSSNRNTRSWQMFKKN